MLPWPPKIQWISYSISFKDSIAAKLAAWLVDFASLIIIVFKSLRIIYDTLETVSGLKFYNEHYNPGKIIVEVEKINNDGSIVCSNSAYGGSRFYMTTLTPPNYYYGSAYTFQGFIYNPTDFIDPDDPSIKKTKKSKFPWVLYARKFRNIRGNN